MADGFNIQLVGAKELSDLFKKLPPKIQRKQMLTALKNAAKPIVNAAKANISGYSKSIANNIGSFNGKNTNAAVIYTGVKVGRKSRGVDPWFAKFVEFGTSGVVNRKSRKVFNPNPAFAWVSKLKRGSKYREDQQAKPFMRPAIAANMPKSEQIIQTELAKVLLKAIDKTYKKVSV